MSVEIPSVQPIPDAPSAAPRQAVTSTPRRFAGVLGLLVWSLLGCSLGGLAGRLWWILDLMSHFRIQYLAVACVALLLTMVQRRWKLLLPLSVCVFVNVYLVYPFYVTSPAEGLPGETLRVMSMNVNTGNRQRQAVVDMVLQYEPDVLFVLEYSKFWRTALLPLESTYRYTRQVSREDNFGIAVYSRRPWLRAEEITLQTADVPAIEVTLEASDHTWRLLGAHVLPPVAAQQSRARNEQLGELAQRMAKTTGPCALVGDLNCTPWSPHFWQLLKVSSLRDSSRGFGVHGTWPTQLPILLIPIDHCLVSNGVEVTGRWVTGDYGSDHRGLVIDLAAPR